MAALRTVAVYAAALAGTAEGRSWMSWDNLKAWSNAVYGQTMGAKAVVGEWPVDKAGAPMDCDLISILEDHADPVDPWKASCLGLAQVTQKGTYTNTECEEVCKNNVECQAWQLTPDDQCYVSIPGFKGYSCHGRDGDADFQAKGGQRMQHGKVAVITTLSAVWVDGLYNVGMFHAGDAITDHKRCKNECYSDVNCRFWQYGQGGCWVERKAHKVTLDTLLSNSTNEAKTQVAGEVVQHYCRGAKPMSFRNLAMAVVGIIMVVIGSLMFLYFLYQIYRHCTKTKVVKKTRGVKLASPAPKMETVPLIPAPEARVLVATPMLVPGPSVVAPPVVGSSVMVPPVGMGSVVANGSPPRLMSMP